MATFFGEIYQRPSRAFWDDEEDYEDDDEVVDIVDSSTVHESDLELQCSEDQLNLSAVIELFVIANGSLAKGFVENCCNYNETPLATIKEKRSLEVEGRPIKKEASFLHCVSESVLLCICSPKLDIKCSFEFTEKIAAWLRRSKKVIILTSNHHANYISGEDSQTFPAAFLKGLHTKSFKDNLLCDRLEQPNIVSGIPAGVLTWCEINNVPAALYVCFIENFTVDSISAQPFIKLFSSFPQKLLKEKPNFKKKAYGAVEMSTNLYV